MVISGSATITPSKPPNSFILASISPKVLLTDSLPGNTLMGPVTTGPFLPLPAVLW